MEEQSPVARVQPWQVNVVIALLVLLIIVAATHTWKSYQAPQPVRWEYTVKNVPDADFYVEMGSLGAEGWELVSARRASVGEINVLANPKPEFRYEMIFRRPVGRGRPVAGP